MNLERQLKPLLYRILSLYGELEILDQKGQLASLTQIWAYDNHDLNLIGYDLIRTIEFFRHRVFPILKIRYPRVIKNLATQHQAIELIQRLVETLNLDRSVKLIADRAIPLFQLINDQVIDETITTNIINPLRPLQSVFQE